MLTVEEFTTPTPISVSKIATLGDVSDLMKTHNIRHVPVIEENVPVGIITDRDLKLLGKFSGWKDYFVGKVLPPSEPFTVSYDTKLDAVAYEMSSRKIGSALVTDETGEIMGIFTSTDALNALVEVVRGEF